MVIGPRCKLKYLDKTKGIVMLYDRPERIKVSRTEKVEGKHEEVTREFYRSGVDEYSELGPLPRTVKGSKNES